MYDFYKISSTSPVVAKILIVNPVAQIMQDLRYMFITPQTITINQVFKSEWARLIPIAIVLATSILAVLYFKKRSPYFAEEV